MYFVLFIVVVILPLRPLSIKGNTSLYCCCAANPFIGNNVPHVKICVCFHNICYGSLLLIVSVTCLLTNKLSASHDIDTSFDLSVTCVTNQKHQCTKAKTSCILLPIIIVTEQRQK